MRLVRRKSRRPEPVEKLQLERVIGLTSCNGNALASNPATGDVAFLAGCVVVVFSTHTFRQTRFFMVSRAPKTLACVAYSPMGGKLIAAGECGHQPAVVIWDASDGSCLAELKAHKYGISCIKFSPNGKHLLSAGFSHDGQICLFDLKSASLISKVKVATATSLISQLHFASDGSFFVTAGNNHLKYWSMGLFASRQRSAGVGLGLHTLDGKNINLGSIRESFFVAVASLEHFQDIGGANNIHPIYALASAGILCLLHRGLAVKKWVNLKVRQAYGLCISGSHIACACSDGIVRVFTIDTLAYVATLPHPAPLGFHNSKDANSCVYFATHNANGINYPDALACCFATALKLVVIYADHSLFIWNIQNFQKIQKCQSFLAHSQCIWDVINLPSQLNQQTSGMADCSSDTGGSDGQGSFATCSSDGSIRLWRMEIGDEGVFNSIDANGGNGIEYDRSMFGVLYQDKQDKPEAKSVFSNHIESPDSVRGFRSISASYDGHFLAAGDRGGNLHIYDLHSFQIANFKEAHDAEILTLSFGTASVLAADNRVVDNVLLASGGRDRLVHIYNASRDFEVIETLDDHSASVTALKFTCDGSKLLSASADKSVVFRNIEFDGLDIKSKRFHQEIASRGTVYDLDIEKSKKLAVTVGQDKKLNFLSLSNGKCVKNFKPEGDSGEPIKVKIDPSGTCLVCSHSDKTLRLYDISNGDMLSLGQGHSEVITGVIFMPDCKRLISVSGDSCIFVWKLPSPIVKMMRKRCNFRSDSQASHASMHPPELSEKQDVLSSIGTHLHMSYADRTGTVPLETVASASHVESGMPSAFKFSVSRLPHWAQAMVSQASVEKEENDLEDHSLYLSDSRWAERLGSEGYKLFCEPKVLLPPATVLPNNCGHRRRFTIEPSASSAYSTPESSLGSHLSGTSSSSPIVSGRNHNNWKTVHTLFFDEEYKEDDKLLDKQVYLLPEKIEEDHNRQSSVGSKVEQREPETFGKDDSTVVYLSDNEQQPAMSIISMLSKNKNYGRCNLKEEISSSNFHTPASVACRSNYRNERTESGSGRSNSSSTQNCMPDFANETQHFLDSPNEIVPPCQGNEDKFVVPTTDDMSDDDESELPFSSDTNLFNSYFGNLSAAVKVQGGKASARSSFSTRYFAQSSHPMPVVSLFQDSPQFDSAEGDDISTVNEDRSSTSTPLAEERNLLKLKELQDNVLTEISVTQFRHGIRSSHMSNYNTKQLLSAEKLQPPLATVTEQNSLEMHGASSADNDFQSSHADCAVLSNDLPAESCLLSSGMDDKLYAVLNFEMGVQEEVLPLSCNKSPKKENDPIDVNSSPVGQEQSVSIDEGERNDGFSIEECKHNYLDTSHDGSSRMIADMLKPEELLSDLKNSLEDLSLALDRAIVSFRQLDLTKDTPSAIVANLSSLHEYYIPPALQKVWLLSDSMTALRPMSQETASACTHAPILECSRTACSEHGSLRLSNTGISRPCTAASTTPPSSAFESVDIQSFIQDYSVRYSTTLANQILALVQKGLSSHFEN